jgi:hypothetical protein
MNIFEEASRRKMRFATSKGLVSVEDLWALKLPELQALAETLDKRVQASTSTNYFGVKPPEDADSKLAFELVVHVGKVKHEEDIARKSAADKEKRRKHILDIMARKTDAELEGKSLNELREELGKL